MCKVSVHARARVCVCVCVYARVYVRAIYYGDENSAGWFPLVPALPGAFSRVLR